MTKKVSNKHYGLIALILAAFMVTATYNDAYAQYGGGGGGGGAGSFTILESFVGAGSGTNPTLNVNGICYIENITIELTRDGGTFTLSSFKITKPANVRDAPNTPLLYCRVTVPSHINALIARATIDISVPKSELDERELELYRLNEASGVWEEISVTKVEEDATHVMYRAVLDHFSFFALVKGEAAEEIPEMPRERFSETFRVEGFNVKVTLTSGEVESIDVNIDEISLNLMLTNVEEDAILTIDIPRGLLDAKNPDGSDTEFSVIIDGELVGYEETTTDNIRRLTIEVPAGSEEVTIIGTFVVPEFGIIAMMILAVSIAGTLLASRRYIKI